MAQCLQARRPQPTVMLSLVGATHAIIFPSLLMLAIPRALAELLTLAVFAIDAVVLLSIEAIGRSPRTQSQHRR